MATQPCGGRGGRGGPGGPGGCPDSDIVCYNTIHDVTGGYEGFDDGCSESAPVCVRDQPQVIPADVWGTACAPCLNTLMSDQHGTPDDGCPYSHPLCLADNGRSPRIWVRGVSCGADCVDTADGNGVDRGCNRVFPICTGDQCSFCVNNYENSDDEPDMGCTDPDKPKCVDDDGNSPATGEGGTHCVELDFLYINEVDKITRVDLDDTTFVTEVTLSTSQYVAVHHESRDIFYCDEDTLYRADKDFANPVAIVVGVTATGIAVDQVNDKVYWSDILGEKIMRANLDGSAQEEVVTGVEMPAGLSMDLMNGWLYFLLKSSNTFMGRVMLDDFTTVETLIISSSIDENCSGNDVTLDVAGGKVYFTTECDAVFRADLDGQNVEEWATGEVGVFGIEVSPSSGHVYWVSLATPSKIRKAAIEDSPVAMDVTEAGCPFGLAISL